MKVKANELTGIALDWAVAKCKPFGSGTYWETEDFLLNFHPSTDWSQGGPIIERELYKVTRNIGGTWLAQIKYRAPYYSPTYDCDIGTDAYINRHGSTSLEAAMRCYVASKLGDEIELPNELMELLK